MTVLMNTSVVRSFSLDYGPFLEIALIDASFSFNFSPRMRWQSGTLAENYFHVELRN